MSRNIFHFVEFKSFGYGCPVAIIEVNGHRQIFKDAEAEFLVLAESWDAEGWFVGFNPRTGFTFEIEDGTWDMFEREAMWTNESEAFAHVVKLSNVSKQHLKALDFLKKNSLEHYANLLSAI